MKIIKKIKKNNGFALLYAVMLSSILLAITIGVLNIALKEINFSTSAKDTNDAFFAADTGAECALYYDKSDNSVFPVPDGGNAQEGQADPEMSCAGNNSIQLNGTFPSWQFSVSGLGDVGQGCALVTVTKDNITDPNKVTTSVVSKGYSSGGGTTCTPGTNSVERELDVSY